MSETTSSSDHSTAWIPRAVRIYLGVLVVLTIIALAPGMITLGTLLFILPGMALIAAPTLLYYSLGALPGYLIAQYSGQRLLGAAVAVVMLAAAALLPHAISQHSLGKLVASDHADPVPSSFQPRSFELPQPERAEYWMNWQDPDSHETTPPPPCADLCQQLLFKANIDHVFVRDHNGRNAKFTSTFTLEKKPDGSPQRVEHITWLPRWRRFHLEQRENCPDTLSLIAGEFTHDVVGGRCLIEETVDNQDADVRVSLFKPLDVRGDDGQFRPDLHVAFATVESDPVTITVTERRDGKAIPVELRTALHASNARVPLYFTAKRCGGGGEIPNLCLTAASELFANNQADAFEMINRRYGLSVAQSPKPARLSVAPASENDRATVGIILKRDYAGGLIATTQSKLVAGFISGRLKSGQLNQDDIDLFGLLLKQHAFAAAIETDKLPSETVQALKPLLPEMFARIAYRADGQQEMVQSLNVLLERYPAEETEAYSATLCQDPKNAGLRVCYQREFRERRKN